MPRCNVLCVAALGAVAACTDWPFGSRSSDRAPASIRIEAPRSLIIEGESMRLRFTMLDRRGREIPNLPSGATVQWAESGNVLTVHHDGTVLGVHPGYGKVSLKVVVPDEAELMDEVTIRVDPEIITMHVVGAYLVQIVQRMEGTVPLVARRDALLRVFVQGDKVDNAFKPPLHAYLYHNETLQETLVLQMEGSKVPTLVDEGQFAGSWYAHIPEELVRPGLGFSVVVDPEETVPRRPESITRYPRGNGIRAVTVREVPPHRVRFIPIQVPTGATGNVHAGNAPAFFELFLRLFPVTTVEYSIRETYTTSTVAAGGEAWSTILNEVWAIRQADGASEYYYGVMPSLGGGGVAFVGRPAAIGSHSMAPHGISSTSASTVFAHEVGHNFGRRHAACGGAGGPDPNYPHDGGRIGVFGVELGTLTIRTPELGDVMSYCMEWISDYTFQGALAFRRQEAAMGTAAMSDPEPVLLVWGRIKSNGDLLLEPAFELTGRPNLPDRPGPYELEGVDEGGAVLFSISFAGEEVAEASGVRLFAFTVPIGHLEPNRLQSLRLRGPQATFERVRSGPAELIQADAAPMVTTVVGPDGELQFVWPLADYPMALVRDRETGDILAFARAGRGALPVSTDRIEVLLSRETGSVRALLR